MEINTYQNENVISVATTKSSYTKSDIDLKIQFGLFGPEAVY